MAKLRDAHSYRRVKRSYTRHSKLRSKGYIKGAPQVKVTQYDMGNAKISYSHEVRLVATRTIQIRDNALEAARQTAARWMDLNCAKSGYHIKLRAVPHHILRENPLASGAGADRFQQGMSLAYGNPIGHAAQVKAGKILFSFFIDAEHIDIAKEAARKANTKLPMHCTIEVEEVKQ